jgi:hypothetical protein
VLPARCVGPRSAPAWFDVTRSDACLQAQKAARRLQREGAVQQVDPEFGCKPCDVCQRMVGTLIRCQIDASKKWFMVSWAVERGCPRGCTGRAGCEPERGAAPAQVCGRCWRDVSGGVVDGDAAHPHYR